LLLDPGVKKKINILGKKGCVEWVYGWPIREARSRNGLLAQSSHGLMVLRTLLEI
jgi:hypothetical protein